LSNSDIRGKLIHISFLFKLRYSNI